MSIQNHRNELQSNIIYWGFFYIVFSHGPTKMVDNIRVNFIVVYRRPTSKNIGRFQKLKNNVNSHTIIVRRK